MSNPYVIQDIGGKLTITGLPASVNAATAISARIVTSDGRKVTNFVAMTDGQNGNNWSGGTFVAAFQSTDFLILERLNGCELHVKATVGGTDEGYKTGNTIEVEAVR